MRAKKIKLLVVSCYDHNKLNDKKVFNIAKYFKRRDLKRFVRELKRYEEKNNIVVTIASEIYNKEVFKSYFPNKNLIFKYDPSLLAGVRIERDDNVYDFNLKSILEKESLLIEHYYD